VFACFLSLAGSGDFFPGETGEAGVDFPPFLSFPISNFPGVLLPLFPLVGVIK